MQTVPLGYLVTVTMFAVCTVCAVAPPRPRHSSPSNLSFWLGYLINEVPLLAVFWLLASTVLAAAQNDLATPVAWVALAVAGVTMWGLGVVAWRALQTGTVVEQALRTGLGAQWRATIDAGLRAQLRRRLPYARMLVAPFVVRRRAVERVANLSYGPAGNSILLDVYRHRSQPADAPTLVYFHGGAFRSGRKNREALPLLYRLASQGWVCISANYRLSPAATFADQLLDVKRVLAWVRTEGQQYGADPRVVFVAGSSAGGHLAATAALTPNQRALQPGFEQVDTSVTAVVVLYGYYGSASSTEGMPSSPVAYLRPDAPPFFVAHGTLDTIVLVEDARAFVARLHSTSANPVVYAELPGAQHVFDLFHSLRFDAVVDGIEAFAAWVRTKHTTAPRTVANVPDDDSSTAGATPLFDRLALAAANPLTTCVFVRSVTIGSYHPTTRSCTVSPRSHRAATRSVPSRIRASKPRARSGRRAAAWRCANTWRRTPNSRALRPAFIDR